jgi:hypothetical protein
LLLLLLLLLLWLLLLLSTNQTHTGGPHARSALPSAFPSLKNWLANYFRKLVIRFAPKRSGA